MHSSLDTGPARGLESCCPPVPRRLQQHRPARRPNTRACCLASCNFPRLSRFVQFSSAVSLRAVFVGCLASCKNPRTSSKSRSEMAPPESSGGEPRSLGRAFRATVIFAPEQKPFPLSEMAAHFATIQIRVTNHFAPEHHTNQRSDPPEI